MPTPGNFLKIFYYPQSDSDQYEVPIDDSRSPHVIFYYLLSFFILPILITYSFFAECFLSDTDLPPRSGQLWRVVSTLPALFLNPKMQEFTF